jgi:hypothetical protein
VVPRASWADRDGYRLDQSSSGARPIATFARLRDVAPPQFAVDESMYAPQPDDRWWAPEDIGAPPTTERLTPAPPLFTREDVDSVLRDL